ncbi:hypothetical protein [Shewanella aestuarii]|uniref:Uncharacterized protein n=1 Tax=Shewanella aestuarii TaxID=1028752 RepID=A0A6G9QR96_9GAMM|nr:hypothetical protein [Shewanella aestuarii]QIR16557.1 hypothetical protein HBH39_18960 [Shewanella aestuarii]
MMEDTIEAMLFALSEKLPNDERGSDCEEFDGALELCEFGSLQECDETEIVNLLDWFQHDDGTIKEILAWCESHYSADALVQLLARLCYTKLVLNEQVVNLVIKHHPSWRKVVTDNQNGICPVTLLYLKKKQHLVDLLLENGLSKDDLMGIKSVC